MKRQWVLIAVSLLLLSLPLRAQNERFKALFVYNFTRYLEWPSSRQGGDFVITVVGSSDIQKELMQIASKKKVGSRSIIVKNASNVSSIPQSHMVYVPASESAQLGKVVASAGTNGTVVISDAGRGISEGAAFNFIERNGKQSFEVSPSTLKRQGVKVSSDLLSLGVVR